MKTSKTGLFDMRDHLIQELESEIHRVITLPKKKFKIEFGKKTNWNLDLDKLEDSGISVLNDQMVRRYLRTKYHEFKSRGLL